MVFPLGVGWGVGGGKALFKTSHKILNSHFLRNGGKIENNAVHTAATNYIVNGRKEIQNLCW